MMSFVDFSSVFHDVELCYFSEKLSWGYTFVPILYNQLLPHHIILSYDIEDVLEDIFKLKKNIAILYKLSSWGGCTFIYSYSSNNKYR